MKKTATFLHFLFCFASVYGQGEKYTIQNYSLVSGTNEARRILQRENGNYIIAGSGRTPPNTWNSFVAQLNGNSYELIDARFDWAAYHSYIMDMVGLNDTNFFGIGYTVNIALDDDNAYQANYSSNGSFSAGILPYPPFEGVMHCVLATKDKGLLLAGDLKPTTTSSPNWEELALIKLDSLYNVLWDTIYMEVPLEPGTVSYDYNSKFKEMVEGPGDTYYLLATVEDNWGWTPDGGVLVMQIDGGGDILRAKQFDLGLDEQAYDITNTADGGLLFTAITNQESNEDRTPHICKLDADWNLQWHNDSVFRTGVVLRALQLSDGGYVLAGSFFPSGYGPNYADSDSTYRLDAAIARLDSAGNLLWQRIYHSEQHDYIYDMIFEGGDTSGKSGFVLCGRDDTIGGASLLLLKLNCMGLLHEPKAGFSWWNSAQNQQRIRFANTSLRVYADSTDGGHYLIDYGDGSPPEQIDTDDFGDLGHQYAAPGDYTVRLTALVCNDTSTIEQTVSVWPTTIGQAAPPRPVAAIAPNPASRQAELSYDLQGKGGVFELYDYTGKRLQRLKLHGRGRQTLNLGGHAAGVYLYVLRSGDGAVFSDKLIIAK